MSLSFKENNINTGKEILNNPSYNVAARFHLENDMNQEVIIDFVKGSKVAWIER